MQEKLLVLNHDQLNKLVRRIEQDLIRYNSSEQLDKFFVEFSKEKYLEDIEPRLEYTDNASILVIGDSRLKESNIMALAKECGINPKLVECHLDYSKMPSYNFSKLEYNVNYKCIIVGPVPHSVPGKENYKSIITKMQSEPEKYPKVIKLEDESSELKITKSNLRKAFMEIK